MTTTIFVMPPTKGISTHTLTWSVTGRVLKCPDSMNISTHTLTWSVTLSSIADFCSSIYFNSHAHVERDSYALVYVTRHGFVNIT